MWLAGLLLVVGCGGTLPHYRQSEAAPPYGAEETAPRWRLVLVGDAGRVAEDAPLLGLIADLAGRAPERTTVLYLGDNVYEHGVPAATSENRLQTEAVLRRQADAATAAGAECFFLPGNHDWEGDPQALLRQSQYIDTFTAGAVRLTPSPTSAGPDTLDRPGVRIITLDTELLIRDQSEGVRHPALWSELGALVDVAPGIEVVLAVHHPPKTYGPHGGRRGWREKVPVFGWLGESVVAGARRLVGYSEDSWFGPYEAVSEQLRKAVDANPPLVLAAGHDHNLQVLRGEDAASFLLISGSGSKLSGVGWEDDTLFCDSAPGLMVVDFYADNAPLLKVWRIDETGIASEAYRTRLRPS